MTKAVRPGSWRTASRAKARSCRSLRRSLVVSASSAGAGRVTPAAERAVLTRGLRFSLSRARMARSANSSRSSGSASILSVWPVGAVSSTTRSRSGSRSNVRTFSKATSSSTPGGGVSSASAKDARPSVVASVASLDSTASFRISLASAAAASASISSTSSPGKAVTGVRVPNGWPVRPRASPRECAGSVETTHVLNPASAAATAIVAAVVDLPTPPFPPHTTSFDDDVFDDVSSKRSWGAVEAR
mmetsp:Transcript_14405/g.43641  ORF Transcript_14405/g.43641 Transcript_14405/m.43641 type:complete len:245 (+) Transcript_14405:534-1268(+)